MEIPLVNEDPRDISFLSGDEIIHQRQIFRQYHPRVIHEASVVVVLLRC